MVRHLPFLSKPSFELIPRGGQIPGHFFRIAADLKDKRAAISGTIERGEDPGIVDETVHHWFVLDPGIGIDVVNVEMEDPFPQRLDNADGGVVVWCVLKDALFSRVKVPSG